LIIIDYLQLMSLAREKDSRQQEISEISRALKILAKDMKIPVVALSQLNRSLETREDKRPRLSDLRESGAIEQDADLVMFVHREEYYQTNDEDRERVRGEAEILVRKQRNGPTGDVKLTWLHDYTRFENRQPAPYEEFGSPPPDDF
jgi:replicative DNA helicase